jgi:hypothetical protein
MADRHPSGSTQLHFQLASGRVSVGHGRVGDATLDASGAGAIDMGADTGDAEVDISGAAEVHFAKVSGRLDKDVSGAGSVSVGN